MSITLEYLKTLEIPDEHAKKIVAEYDKAIQKYADYDVIKGSYEQQGKDLAALQKLDPQTLLEQIGKLTEQHKLDLGKIKAESAENIKKMAVKMQLSSTHDPDLLLSLLDLKTVIADENGNITGGLAEQVEALKDSKGFLFKTDTSPNFSGVKPAQGSPSSASHANYTEKLAEARKSNNSALAYQIIAQAAEQGEQLR